MSDPPHPGPRPRQELAALRVDERLDPRDDAWLDAHLAGCEAAPRRRRVRRAALTVRPGTWRPAGPAARPLGPHRVGAGRRGAGPEVAQQSAGGAARREHRALRVVLGGDGEWQARCASSRASSRRVEALARAWSWVRRSQRVGARGIGGLAAASASLQAEALAGAVRSARAATWETPIAGRELEAGQAWSSARRSAVRCRSGIRSSARWSFREPGVHHEVLGRRRRVAGLADEGHEAHDLVAAEVVEGDPVGDLVQPRAGVLGLLERVVGAVCLHERVLGQVRRELGVRSMRSRYA